MSTINRNNNAVYHGIKTGPVTYNELNGIAVPYGISVVSIGCDGGIPITIIPFA